MSEKLIDLGDARQALTADKPVPMVLVTDRWLQQTMLELEAGRRARAMLAALRPHADVGAS